MGEIHALQGHIVRQDKPNVHTVLLDKQVRVGLGHAHRAKQVNIALARQKTL